MHIVQCTLEHEIRNLITIELNLELDLELELELLN